MVSYRNVCRLCQARYVDIARLVNGNGVADVSSAAAHMRTVHKRLVAAEIRVQLRNEYVGAELVGLVLIPNREVCRIGTSRYKHVPGFIGGDAKPIVPGIATEIGAIRERRIAARVCCELGHERI